MLSSLHNTIIVRPKGCLELDITFGLCLVDEERNQSKLLDRMIASLCLYVR